MSRTFIVDGVGREWSVDADAMYALVRANIGAEEIRRRTTKAMPVRHVFGPDVFRTTTDWNGFRAALNDQSERWWKETRLRLSNLPGEQVVQELILMREDSANRTREVLDLQTDAQHKTMTSIHDKRGRRRGGREGRHRGARCVRDDARRRRLGRNRRPGRGTRDERPGVRRAGRRLGAEGDLQLRGQRQGRGARSSKRARPS